MSLPTPETSHPPYQVAFCGECTKPLQPFVDDLGRSRERCSTCVVVWVTDSQGFYVCDQTATAVLRESLPEIAADDPWYTLESLPHARYCQYCGQQESMAEQVGHNRQCLLVTAVRLEAEKVAA